MDNTLDLEQLEKRLDWLDNERRNDKTIIAALQGKLENMGTENAALRIRLSDIESDITRLNTLMARLEQYDLDINRIKKDIGQKLQGFKTSLQEKERQADKNQKRLETIHANLTEIDKKVQAVKEIKETLEVRNEKVLLLEKQIEELKSQVKDTENFNEDYKRSLHLVEENRRQDAKRLSNIQGEVAAVRKREDETRGKQDLISDNMRKLDNRIKDLLEAESERQESQTAFIEKINLAQVERDQVFKAWEDRFNEMEQINTGLEKELSDLENTHRSVKQSQANLDEVTQRFERRVNEITEIQRLNEERFRQEWTTFKSDDQKRWSNYTLTQEEQHREINRNIENLGNRISTLEDLLEDMKDNIQQIGKDDLKRMQTLLSSFRESIDTYNNIFKG